MDILEAWNLRTWFSGFFSGDSCETWFLNFRKDNKGDERNMSKKESERTRQEALCH